jgi:hypothetical protein
MLLGRSRKTRWDKLNGTHQLLAYADDVNLLGDNIYNVKKNTGTLIDAKEIGLEVNVEKTKYKLLSHQQNAGQDWDIKIVNRWFENVSQFKYLGMTVPNLNLIQKEERRLNSGNACYPSVQILLSSCLLSKNIKIRIHKTVILPLVLYGYATWSLTIKEEHRLRVFENRVLRRIFGPKRDDVKGEGCQVHNKEIRDLHSSPSIIRMIKLRRMRWTDNVARMVEYRNAYRLLVGKPEGKRPLGRPRRRWVDNIRMDLGEIGFGGVDWIDLVQDRDKQRALANAVINLRVLLNAGKLSSGSTTCGLLSSAQPRIVSLLVT